MKTILLQILIFTCFVTVSYARPQENKIWLYFDLGNTLVDTKTHNFEKIFYMPGALAYLKELKQRGYPLGLLVNIPESWGANYDEKLKALKKLIADHWTDSDPMDWDMFNAGILLPPDDAHRKPHPFMFQAAASLAQKHGATVFYQGDEPSEIETAKKLGIPAYLVGSQSQFYFPPGKIGGLKLKIQQLKDQHR